MRNPTFTMSMKSSLLAVTILFTTLAAFCAPAPTNSQSKRTNAAVQMPIVIPKSEFAIPTTLAAGRDPFFPNRAVLNNNLVGTNTTTAAVSPTFTLSGVSGTKVKRYALINNRTFEAGEEGDITVGRSKVRIRCISIEEDSAVIEFDGRPQTLKLRPGL